MHLCKLQLQIYKLQLQFLENSSCSFPEQLLKSVILLECLLFPKNCSCSFPKNCSCSFLNCNCSFSLHKCILQPEGTLSVLICFLLRNMKEPCLTHPQVPGTAKSSNHFLNKTRSNKKHTKTCLFSSRSKHTKVKHEHRHADKFPFKCHRNHVWGPIFDASYDNFHKCGHFG